MLKNPAFILKSDLSKNYSQSPDQSKGGENITSMIL